MTENLRPHPENPKQHAPEAGAGPLGLPPPEPEQTAQGGGVRSPERQGRPNVWDILERGVRLSAPDVEDRPRWGTQQYQREVDELDRLYRELDKKGTPRDRLIRELYSEIRYEPAPFPSPVRVRQLTLEEFQQFRSKIDPLSDEEVAGELHKAEEENDRKSDEFFKKKGGGFPPQNSIVRV